MLVLKFGVLTGNSSNLGGFSFLRSGRPKRTGSGQFKWKSPKHILISV